MIACYFWVQVGEMQHTIPAVNIGDLYLQNILQWVWSNIEYYSDVKFKLVTVVIMSSSISFDVTKCILMERYGHSEETFAFIRVFMAEEKMEAHVKPLCISKKYTVPQRGSTSETLIHTDKLHVISRKHL